MQSKKERVGSLARPAQVISEIKSYINSTTSNSYIIPHVSNALLCLRASSARITSGCCRCERICQIRNNKWKWMKMILCVQLHSARWKIGLHADTKYTLASAQTTAWEQYTRYTHVMKKRRILDRQRQMRWDAADEVGESARILQRPWWKRWGTMEKRTRKISRSFGRSYNNTFYVRYVTLSTVRRCTVVCACARTAGK